ncbi:MAG: hypothetical protein HOG76_00805 [Candidatus Marinimicrobia bacterium]|nr:hypothetical protein [Candidatus Neomarinimicrobiota bacterium]
MTCIEMVGTVGVMELTDSPPGFELYPNFANPFSPIYIQNTAAYKNECSSW